LKKKLSVTNVLIIGDSHAERLARVLMPILTGSNVSVENLWVYGNNDGLWMSGENDKRRQN
jgi:hypothetical protein